MSSQPPAQSINSAQAQEVEAAFEPRRSRAPLVEALIRLWHMRMGKFGVIVFVALVILAIGAPLFAPYDPAEQFRGHELEAPNGTFLLGTDQLGRDLLSRLIYGSRASLIAGVLAVAIGAVIGISSGLVAGYSGGWIDAVIMRIYDGLMTFPNILLAIAVVTATGPGLTNIAFAIGIAQAPMMARLCRSVVLSQRERDYVLAARSLGASGSRIVIFHILPNTLPLLLVQFALSMGFAVLAEGSLSFLGLGTQPPTASWGSMLNDGRSFLRDAPWYGFYPGFALALLLIALNFLADSLREALDPRRIHAKG